MAAHRAAPKRKYGSPEIPAPCPWRSFCRILLGPVPSINPLSRGVNFKPLPFQLGFTSFSVIYICFSFYALQEIASEKDVASFSNTGRNVLYSLSEVFNGRSTEGPKTGGVAIVAACRNRQDTLAKVLPTWLAVPGVDEIILVDWSSDPPLRSLVQPEKEEKLKLYRVEGENSWVLSRAYNLALNKTNRDFIIRTDCDYSLKGTILKAHNLSKTETGFYAGNWMQARDKNEAHLNGAMMIKRDVFWRVGGYDERIQTYGWDDEDLYSRLTASNFTKLNVSYDHVAHVFHGDDGRAQGGVKFAKVQIDLNRLLLEKLPPWSKSMRDMGESSTYRVVKKESSRYVELKAISIPKSLRKRLDPQAYEESWALALGRRLADDYHVPWDILQTMDSENKELLLRSLMSLQNDLDTKNTEQAKRLNSTIDKTKFPKHARMLLVHCMNGLGNRLRALGSALAFARNAKRVPVVIWEVDAHVAAEFDDLFNTSGLVVMKKFTPTWPFANLHRFDASWLHFDFYNYMEMEEGSKKGELIVNNPEKHLYYKGAYIMKAPDYSCWEAENKELQKLEPAGMVQRRLKELEEQNLRGAIGVHIRNRTLAEDIKNMNFDEEYGSKAAATMEHWRSQSCYKTFVKEMRRILKEENAEAKFYVASDTNKIISIMERKFPGRILSTKRTCDGRDSECMKYAVIDMYALRLTKQLLGSSWSSFTEMVERLGGLNARLAGKDFGGSSETGTTEARNVENIRKSVKGRQYKKSRWTTRSKKRMI